MFTTKLLKYKNKILNIQKGAAEPPNIFSNLKTDEILYKSTDLSFLYYKEDFNPITMKHFENILSVKEMFKKEYDNNNLILIIIVNSDFIINKKLVKDKGETLLLKEQYRIDLINRSLQKFEINWIYVAPSNQSFSSILHSITTKYDNTKYHWVYELSDSDDTLKYKKWKNGNKLIVFPHLIDEYTMNLLEKMGDIKAKWPNVLIAKNSIELTDVKKLYEPVSEWLIQNEIYSQKYLYFNDENHWLHNFFKLPFTIGDITFSTNEHFYIWSLWNKYNSDDKNLGKQIIK
jgi:hypothetical protein